MSRSLRGRPKSARRIIGRRAASDPRRSCWYLARPAPAQEQDSSPDGRFRARRQSRSGLPAARAFGIERAAAVVQQRPAVPEQEVALRPLGRHCARPPKRRLRRKSDRQRDARFPRKGGAHRIRRSRPFGAVNSPRVRFPGWSVYAAVTSWGSKWRVCVGWVLNLGGPGGRGRLPEGLRTA